MKYRVACFDVDGTLIDDTVFIWNTLHDHFRVPAEIRRQAYDDYFAGRISYAEWAEQDVAHWRAQGVTRQAILEVVSGLRPMIGAEETLRTLAEAGLVLGVISGTLDIALETVFPSYRKLLRHVFLNRLRFEAGGLIAGLDPTPYDVENKGQGLIEIARLENCRLEETVFVGDNFNDLSVARLAGLAIAFNCKSRELAETADVVVPGKDLRAILPHILS